MYILLKLSILDEQVNLEDYSSLTTYFETHMNNYLGLDNGRKLVGNHCSNKTYFNGEDISRSYDLVDGKDKINRIYDLYNGIINERNIYDIDSIRLGFLNSDCFDIRKLKNINVLENELIGKEKEYDDNYLTNVKKLLNYKYGYDGDLKLERESLLDAISYRMSANLLAKKQVEKIIGVPYDEFDLLDFDEQQKLIEEMTNKKLLGTVCKEKCLERVNNLEDKKTTKILRKIFKKNNKK